MVNSTTSLHFEFVDYWHAGTGMTGGNHLDALVQKDADGLPLLNGRHIKGLLRQAVRLNEKWGALPIFSELAAAAELRSVKDWETLLFGSRNQADDSNTTQAGVLFISDARLTPAESCYIQQQGLAPQLFRTLFNTRINEQGVADDKSLRAIEVAVPMQLTAELEIDSMALLSDDSLLTNIRSVIEHSLPLIRYAGGGRTRGLGRVRVTMTDQAAEAA